MRSDCRDETRLLKSPNAEIRLLVLEQQSYMKKTHFKKINLAVVGEKDC